VLNTLINYSVQSMGLIPLLAFIFLLGISIIIERFVFFSKAVRAGDTLEHDLKLLNGQDLDQANKVVEHYKKTVQSELVKSALTVRGKEEAVVEREIEETIMFQMPRLDRNLWVLDTAVTLGPLLGLLGTIIGMVEWRFEPQRCDRWYRPRADRYGVRPDDRHHLRDLPQLLQQAHSDDGQPV
jgi:biopolymer transport protein ExbB